jgi:hypothetical protein
LNTAATHFIARCFFTYGMQHKWQKSCTEIHSLTLLGRPVIILDLPQDEG